MSGSGYYLIDHPNPNARADSDGRYHGYPGRRKKVSCIVIHTAENTPDTVAADGGAEAVARYQARVDRPSSYHDLVDSDSHVRMLPWSHTAFHASNDNSYSIGLSMATKAHLWPHMPAKWTERTLDNLATVAASAVRWVQATEGVKIPVQTVTAHAARNGKAGFIAHGTLDPGRRSDPGATFPWGRFLSKTSAKLGQRPPPDPGDDDLSEKAERQIEAVYNRVVVGADEFGVPSMWEIVANQLWGAGGDAKTLREYDRDLVQGQTNRILEVIAAVAPPGTVMTDERVNEIAAALAKELSA